MLLAVALLARLVVVGVVGDDFHFADETDYWDAVDRILDGNGFGSSYDRAPAYPIILTAFSLISSSDALGLRIAQAIVAALAIVLVYRIVLGLFGPGPAFFAGLFYALDPLLVFTTAFLYPEALAAVVFSAIIVLSLDMCRRASIPCVFLLGLLLGLLIELRTVAYVMVPVVLMWTLLVTPAPAPRRIAHAAILAIAVCAAVAPWAYRNRVVNGSVAFGAMAGTQSAPLSEDNTADQGLIRAYVQEIQRSPGEVFQHVTWEFRRFWELYPTRVTTDWPHMRERLHDLDPRLSRESPFPRGLRNTVSLVTCGIGFAAAITGLFVALRRRPRESLLLIALVVVFALGYSLFSGKIRYRVPILPAVFVFAGVGADLLWRQIRSAVRSLSKRS